MHSTRTKPSPILRQYHWPIRHTPFMTPLPPRRERFPVQPWNDRDVRWDREAHTAIYDTLRKTTVLVLWLLAVLALILLFAGTVS